MKKLISLFFITCIVFPFSIQTQSTDKAFDWRKILGIGSVGAIVGWLYYYYKGKGHKVNVPLPVHTSVKNNDIVENEFFDQNTTLETERNNAQLTVNNNEHRYNNDNYVTYQQIKNIFTEHNKKGFNNNMHALYNYLKNNGKLNDGKFYIVKEFYNKEGKVFKRDIIHKGFDTQIEVENKIKELHGKGESSLTVHPKPSETHIKSSKAIMHIGYQVKQNDRTKKWYVEKEIVYEDGKEKFERLQEEFDNKNKAQDYTISLKRKG